MEKLSNQFKELECKGKVGDDETYTFLYRFIGTDGKKGSFETPYKHRQEELCKGQYFTKRRTTITEEFHWDRAIWDKVKGEFEVIEDDSRDFVRGYKVVTMKDGSFAYLREEDGKLLPYRFDIASDFNELGFAMVGLGRGVTWLNKKFEILTGTYWEPYTDLGIHEAPNWCGVREFSGSPETKLSALFQPVFGGNVLMGCYMNSFGELQYFYRFNGELKPEKTDCIVIPQKSILFRGTVALNLKDYDFDGNGYLRFEDRIYFARGFFITLEDLFKLSKQRGLLENLNREVKHLQMHPVDSTER